MNVDINEMQGDWYLQEYVNSHDGKPIGANQPYLCPESRMQVVPNAAEKVGQNILYVSVTNIFVLQSMNASQISYEWPVTFVDTVEWVQHPEKSGVFFHEENIFSLWTMKIMDISPQ